MPGTYTRHRTTAWHAHPGDAMEDSRNVAGIVLCYVGIGALATTLVAAGSGFAGWALVGSIVTVTTMLIGVTIILAEWTRERAAERRHGRHGHNPLAG